MNMTTLRNRIAWHLFNLGYRVADDWYGNMIVGAVFYGLDKAAKDHGYAGSPIAPSDEYRRRVIASLLRDGERIVRYDTPRPARHPDGDLDPQEGGE